MKFLLALSVAVVGVLAVQMESKIPLQMLEDGTKEYEVDSRDEAKLGKMTPAGWWLDKGKVYTVLPFPAYYKKAQDNRYVFGVFEFETNVVPQIKFCEAVSHSCNDAIAKPPSPMENTTHKFYLNNKELSSKNKHLILTEPQLFGNRFSVVVDEGKEHEFSIRFDGKDLSTYHQQIIHWQGWDKFDAFVYELHVAFNQLADGNTEYLHKTKTVWWSFSYPLLLILFETIGLRGSRPHTPSLCAEIQFVW